VAVMLRKVFFGSGHTEIVDDVPFQSILASLSSLNAENPSIKTGAQQAAKEERLEKTLEMSPVPSWKTRASQGLFRANRLHDGIASSNVLSRLNLLWLNLVAMIPMSQVISQSFTTKDWVAQPRLLALVRRPNQVLALPPIEDGQERPPAAQL
jgi:hypothetical protein